MQAFINRVKQLILIQLVAAVLSTLKPYKRPREGIAIITKAEL
jgi:hypothetical protein